MNKSKYITYTTMALVAFIIIEMNLFTFMFVKGQDEKEYKFEYGTVMDARGYLYIRIKHYWLAIKLLSKNTKRNTAYQARKKNQVIRK